MNTRQQPPTANAAHFTAHSEGEYHFVQATLRTDEGRQSNSMAVVAMVPSHEIAERVARGLNTCLSMLMATDWTGPQ